MIQPTQLTKNIYGIEVPQDAIERDSKEYSVKQAGEYAHNFLTELKEALPK
jgi:hypothetical protein